MAEPTVLLIGGAPGAGKTTLGRALGARLGAVSLTVDDLLTAVKAVTTPQSHPGLHVTPSRNSIDYFTASPVEQLIADADAQHDALWPAIEHVIRKHSSWGPSIVIDGWPLRPPKVAALGFPNVTSVWLVANPAVLEERERRNVAFFGHSRDPEAMLRNFLGRSLWYNDLIERQATELKLKVLRQDGHAAIDTLCAIAIEAIDGGLALSP